MTDGALKGCRVFVAEDEALVGIVLEDILDMLGCEIVGNYAELDEARAASGCEIDVAILDVNLGRDPVYPLADDLLARGVAVVFATGAMPDSLPPRFAACPVLEKPYAFASVESILIGLVRRSPAAAPAG